MLDAVSIGHPPNIPAFEQPKNPVENLFTFHKWLFDPEMGKGELHQLFRSHIEEKTTVSGIYEFLPVELGVLQVLYCHLLPEYSTILAAQRVAGILYQSLSHCLEETDPPACPNVYLEVGPATFRSFGEWECREVSFPRAIVSWPFYNSITDLHTRAAFEHEIACRYLLDQQKFIDTAFSVLSDSSEEEILQGTGEILVDVLALIHLGSKRARTLACYSLNLEHPDEKLLACVLSAYSIKGLEELIHHSKCNPELLDYWRKRVDLLLSILSKSPVKEFGQCTVLDVLNRRGLSPILESKSKSPIWKKAVRRGNGYRD